MNSDRTKVAIYARVSTKGSRQDCDNQAQELRTYCQKRGWEVVEEYTDEASASNPERPAFKLLFEDASKRRFDLVLFWALDRFSREGALETLKHLERLTSLGVSWKSYTEAYLDSAGIFKDAIVAIVGTLAKQERVRISERTKVGLAAAKAKGRRLGRPKKVFDREKLTSRRRAGASLGQLAKEFGISRTHVARLTKDS